jgi:uncharacterized protein YndB with AHSA1/START domain
MTDYGTIEHLDGDRWQLRFTRTLPHPQDKVWRALTEPAQLARWFPSTIEGELLAGAGLRFSFPETVGIDPIAGKMLACEPGSVMEFSWGPDVVRLELRPVEGGTELTLLDTLEERGKAARDGAGWHTCLDALEAALGGDDESRAHMNTWAEVHPHYVESFGPQAATIGPPEGMG